MIQENLTKEDVLYLGIFTEQEIDEARYFDSWRGILPEKAYQDFNIEKRYMVDAESRYIKHQSDIITVNGIEMDFYQQLNYKGKFYLVYNTKKVFGENYIHFNDYGDKSLMPETPNFYTYNTKKTQMLIDANITYIEALRNVLNERATEADSKISEVTEKLLSNGFVKDTRFVNNEGATRWHRDSKSKNLQVTVTVSSDGNVHVATDFYRLEKSYDVVRKYVM